MTTDLKNTRGNAGLRSRCIGSRNEPASVRLHRRAHARGRGFSLFLFHWSHQIRSCATSTQLFWCSAGLGVNSVSQSRLPNRCDSSNKTVSRKEGGCVFFSRSLGQIKRSGADSFYNPIKADWISWSTQPTALRAPLCRLWIGSSLGW